MKLKSGTTKDTQKTTSHTDWGSPLVALVLYPIELIPLELVAFLTVPCTKPPIEHRYRIRPIAPIAPTAQHFVTLAANQRIA